MVVALRLLNGNIASVRTEKSVGLLALLNLFILNGHADTKTDIVRDVNQRK